MLLCNGYLGNQEEAYVVTVILNVVSSIELK